MITVRLQIGDGQIVDTQDYGLIYLSADNVLSAPTKAFEKTTYPEQNGENLLPKTCDEAFDYKTVFFVKADGAIENANKKISDFNALLYTQQTGEDTKEYKQVTFYNDYKRVKIVGYPQPIHQATQFWRDKNNRVLDVVVVEWTIRVPNPSLCDFNIAEQ